MSTTEDCFEKNVAHEPNKDAQHSVQLAFPGKENLDFEIEQRNYVKRIDELSKELEDLKSKQTKLER